MLKMSSSNINSTTAATAPEPLTTPFVPPSTCTDQFGTTSFVNSYYWNNFSTTTVTYLTSEEASSCQPSGWDRAQTESFHYSPAVCPSGWTAYNIGASVSGTATATRTISTASCCSSGFTLSYFSGIPDPSASITACFEDIIGASPSPATTTTHPLPNGLRVHNAWFITWGSSDVAILTPSPPDLSTCTGPVPVLGTWIPGTTVDPGLLSCLDSDNTAINSNDGMSHASPSQTRTMMFVVIGLPIIGFVLLVTCCTVCIRRTLRERKAMKTHRQHLKEEAERRRREAAAQATSGSTEAFELEVK